MSQERPSLEVMDDGYLNWRRCLCPASKGWAVQNGITVAAGSAPARHQQIPKSGSLVQSIIYLLDSDATRRSRGTFEDSS